MNSSFLGVQPLPCESCKADCCYSPWLKNEEAELIRTKYRHLKMIDHPLGGYILGQAGKRCPALNKNRCGIYKDRPQVCRDFGLVSKLPCPKVRN